LKRNKFAGGTSRFFAEKSGMSLIAKCS